MHLKNFVWTGYREHKFTRNHFIRMHIARLLPYVFLLPPDVSMGSSSEQVQTGPQSWLPDVTNRGVRARGSMYSEVQWRGSLYGTGQCIMDNGQIGFPQFPSVNRHTRLKTLPSCNFVGGRQ